MDKYKNATYGDRLAGQYDEFVQISPEQTQATVGAYLRSDCQAPRLLALHPCLLASPVILQSQRPRSAPCS